MVERNTETESDDHKLTEEGGVELPEAALATLRAGLPRELRIAGWPGPALFHSELGAGVLRSTVHEDALVRRVGEHEGYVFGSVRQTPDAPPFSAFVLRRAVGDVYLLDLRDPTADCFANVSLDAFLASMLALHGAFDHLLAASDDREQHVSSFRELLQKIDAKSIELPEHYWPGWLEAMQ